VTCPAATVTLEPGDALIFFTDGVTDRRRGDDFFGLERLKATAERLADLPAEAMAVRVRAAALEFSNEPQRDDMAIMVLRNDYGDV
jgi:serine phosphatase RsbU (regulator of sigma subunit)